MFFSYKKDLTYLEKPLNFGIFLCSKIDKSVKVFSDTYRALFVEFYFSILNIFS